MPSTIEQKLLLAHQRLNQSSAGVPDTAEAHSAPSDSSAPVEEISPVHDRTIAVLTRMLASVSGNDHGPGGMLLKALKSAQPILLRDFRKVPAEQVVKFTHDLAMELLSIGEPGTEATSAVG